MAICSAFGCENSRHKNKNVTFHKFPSEKITAEKWRISMKRKGFVPTQYSVVRWRGGRGRGRRADLRAWHSAPGTPPPSAPPQSFGRRWEGAKRATSAMAASIMSPFY